MSKPTFKDVAKVGKPDGKKAKAPCGHDGTHVSASLVLCDQGCDDEEKTDPGTQTRLVREFFGTRSPDVDYGDPNNALRKDNPFFNTPATVVPCPHKNTVNAPLGIYCLDCGTYLWNP